MEKALIVCTPGLEHELLLELQEVWPFLIGKDGQTHLLPFPEVVRLKGGLEIPCDFHTAAQLNFFLHLATRILFRIAEFRCRDFPKLFQHLNRIPWDQWLASKNICWHVAATGSRLNNEKRIEEVAIDVLRKTSMKNAENIFHDIYIRFFDDNCTVSLDLSGEPLYKRILQKKTGEAPFRETWANFSLRKMRQDISLGGLKDITLVDPYCGSGTFLFEAMYFNFPNYFRAYSFQDFNRSPKLFKSPSFALNYKWPVTGIFAGVMGVDVEEEMVEVTRANSEIYKSIFKTPLSTEFSVHRGRAEDFKVDSNKKYWLIANPPWGQRLQAGTSYEQMLRGIANQWRPERMAVVLPENQVDVTCLTGDYAWLESQRLVLGGIAVQVHLWQKV